MPTHFVSGTSLATGLALLLALFLAAGCETSGEGAPEPGAGMGTVAPVSERGRSFPRPVPRPAPETLIATVPAVPPEQSVVPPGPSPARPAAAGPTEHTVAAGENIYDIARLYEVDAYALAVSNKLRPPFELSEGEVLIIPGTGAAGSGAPAVAAIQPEASGAGEPPVFARPPDRPSFDRATERSAPAVSAEREPHGSVEGNADKETASLPPAQTDSSAPPSSEGFIWPVSGRVVSTFGAKGGGRYNDGINIAAPEGTTVRAAEGGVVAYAGNELRGFGRTLLIKHSGGWVTAYAHNSELLVRRGDQVKRGQAVARVGSTGGVDEPQLHFEIRSSRKAIDPVKLLPRSGASARHGRTEG